MGKFEKEMENKMRVKQARKKLEKTIEECERQEKSLIQKAAEAKKNGLKSELQQTMVFLKMIISRKEKAKHMLHQLTLSELLRQEAINTKEFNDSMIILSKETSKLFGSFDYKKMLKEQRKMAVETQKAKSQLDMILEQVDDSMEDISSMDTNSEMDAELEGRINAQLAEIDINIDEELKNFNLA